MNITEAAVISNGLALVRVENLKFVSDIGDIIKHNIAQADPMDLIFLTKGAFFMRNFKHTRDVYSTVHAQAMTMLKLKKLQPEHVHALSSLFEGHEIITDSPFVSPKIERPSGQ